MPVRITIVTPSYQQASYLEECLCSVHGQGYPDLEHIVVDGGSTDGSRAIIERYAGQLAWWCSERDAGQSAAINKGLSRATGQVFVWLNSDDLLLPGALHAVARWYEQVPQVWAHRGRLLLRAGTEDRQFPEGPIVQDEHRLFLDPLVVQPATFFRTESLRALGGVDEGLHHVMDLELQWQLLFRHGADGLRAHEDILAVFRMHADSKSARMRPRFLAEQAALLHGMLTATGSADLARIVVLGRAIPQGLRGIPVGPEHAALVRRMAVHFLLKWDHAVMERDQYDRMRALRDLLPLASVVLSDKERLWAGQAYAAVDTPGWLAFRIERKWRHLTQRP